MRRAQALHAPAFLIHGDHRIAAHGLAQIAGQAAQLFGIFHIAAKQDEAPGIGRAKEIPLGPRQISPGDAAKDGRVLRHAYFSARQSVPPDFSALQKSRASPSDPKPATRRRQKVRPFETCS